MKVNSRRARGDRQKQEHVKFQLFIRKKDFYYGSRQILEEVTQRGCNLFSLGNIQELTGCVPE